MSAVSGIIVAGGRSSRLGQDKRRLRLWGDAGPTLLEHTVAIAAALCDEIIVVLNDPAAWPDLNVRLIADVWPDAGPLGGIASGLRAARHEWSLVLAADLPLLDVTLLQDLLATPRTALALVPQRGGDSEHAPRNWYSFEPLHALYHRACLPLLEGELAVGKRQVAGILAALAVQVFPIGSADPRARSFTNLNTPADVAALIHAEPPGTKDPED